MHRGLTASFRLASVSRLKRMFSIPRRPWLPASNSSPSSSFTGGVTPAHLITVASALRLGDLLRGHFPAHLTLLLCSPSPVRNPNSTHPLYLSLSLKYISKYCFCFRNSGRIESSMNENCRNSDGGFDMFTYARLLVTYWVDFDQSCV